MTRQVDLEFALREWMDAEAPSAPPDELLAAVLSRTAITRQRPAWVPRLDLSSFPSARFGIAWLVALVLLLTAAVASALLVGQPRIGPTSLENGLIAFVGEGTGENTWLEGGVGSDLYLIDPNGTGLIRLTETTEIEWAPTWSPDGTRLAFIREQSASGPPPPGLDCEADPAACERGTPGEYAVVVTDAAPGTERVVFQAQGAIDSLVWSSDGTRLSFNHERSGGLLMTDLAMGSTRLVLAGAYDIAAWAPDGVRLAAIQAAVGGSGADLYVAFVDGREPIRLTHDDGYEGLPTWSPDGRRIAFSFDPDGSGRASRIELIAADGSGRSVLAEQTYGPAWSPDGTLLAYVRTFGDASGRSNEVWVMTPDGTGQRRLGGDGSRPRWSPDGELVFWRGDEGTWSVRRDGSSLGKLPTGEVRLIGGLSEAVWQPVPR